MLVPELISARSGWLKRAWIGAFERRNLAGAARLHLTSDQELDDLQRCGLVLAPTVILPNGVDVDEPTPRRVTAGQVLYLGRLSWKKNLVPLLDAVADIPEATLVLAGPDDEGLAAALTQQAERAGCADRVRIVGAVGPDQKRELFATSACAVLPSLNENFGNVVIEALAQGCPVVVSPGVGARTIVEKCGGGLVAEGGDAASLRRSITELLDDPASAESRGAAGARYVRANLGWPAIASRMAAVYREICAEIPA
jgi:glycosyltransferase involved in cell wall biosynthesis